MSESPYPPPLPLTSEDFTAFHTDMMTRALWGARPGRDMQAMDVIIDAKIGPLREENARLRAEVATMRAAMGWSTDNAPALGGGKEDGR